MRILSISHLRDFNVVDSRSGAVIVVSGLDDDRRLPAADIISWLGRFPFSLRFPSAPAELSLLQAWLQLIGALSEHARLHPGEPRLLQELSGKLQIWLPIDDQRAAELSARLACHVLSRVLSGDPPDQDAGLLWSHLRNRYWNQTHAHLARAAQQLSIPFYRLDRDGKQMLQLGQGKRLRLCSETLTDQTPLFARSAANKERLHGLLQFRGVPLPDQQTVTSFEQALAAAERIGWPVVLKPADGGKGKGVWVGLQDSEALRLAWQSSDAGAQPRLLLQQMLRGEDHRLLVMNGSLLAVAQRQPARLCCDGVRSLAAQIVALNADPERGVGYERLRNRVPVDERLQLLLAEQGWRLDSVPPAGHSVQLSRTANISQGGSAIDLTDRIHADNRRLAEDIALMLGSDVLGLDFISEDLSVSWRDGGTWLLEANLSAGLRPHLVADPQSDLCQRIVRQWMGDGPRTGRIPTALITGSVGKTTTSRMLAHLLLSSGLRVGLTSSTGVEFDGYELASGDLAGGGAALQLLHDRRMEAVVAEIARGGLLKAGLGIGDNDVSAVLNIRDNHIGSDGIQSREHLAAIKGLIARSGATHLVLNADDPLVMAMAGKRPPGSLALIAQQPESIDWKQHMGSGHLAASYQMKRDSSINLWHRGQELFSMALSDIPASEGGAVQAIAPAAAFSAAMAYCLGVEVDVIRQGLQSFGRSGSHFQGRFELYIADPYRVVITKAGSPEAMQSVSSYAQDVQPPASGRRLLLSVEGDFQTDDMLRAIGRSVGGFDHVIFASRDSRLGRSSCDEVPRLLAEGAASISGQAPEIVQAGTESNALFILFQMLKPGDLCIISNFNVVGTKRVLDTLRAGETQ